MLKIQNKILKNNKKTPYLSFIVPIYNLPPQVIKNNVNGFNKQKNFYSFFEVCFIDDGSDAATKKTLFAQTKKTLFNCRIINKNNGQWGSCVNYGHLKARGEYFCVVDGDDFIEEKFVEKVVKKILELKQPKKAVFAFGNIWFNNNYKTTHTCYSKNQFYTLKNPVSYFPYSARASFVYPRENVENVLLPTKVSHMDRALVFSILNHAEIVVNTNAWYFYRRWDKTSSSVDMTLSEYFAIAKAYNDFLSKQTPNNCQTELMKMSNYIIFLAFKKIIKKTKYKSKKREVILMIKNLKKKPKVISENFFKNLLIIFLPAWALWILFVLFVRLRCKIPFLRIKKHFYKNNKCVYLGLHNELVKHEK